MLLQKPLNFVMSHSCFAIFCQALGVLGKLLIYHAVVALLPMNRKDFRYYQVVNYLCYEVSIEVSINCVPLALAHSVAFLGYPYYEARKYRSVEVLFC